MDKDDRNAVITTYRYDSLGRLTRAICDGHSYEYEYNENGQLKEKRSSGKRLLSYEYDKAGQITAMTDPAGVTTCYEYDLLGRTSRIHSNQGMEAQYRYDRLNRPEQITYGNGIVTYYQYDADGNVKLLETKLKEETLLSYTYRYDGNGNRIEKVGEQGLPGIGNSRLKTTYAYDAHGQLLEERQNNSAKQQDTIFRYTYDASGNRISKESPEGATHYQYNEKNQLVSEEGIRGPNFFTYSCGGSIIREEGDFNTRHFIYNSKNQQVKVACDDGQTQVNRYDSEGLRYEMKENEKLFRFIYHRGELLYEEGKDETTSYQLGYGTEAIQRNERIYYYHKDEQLSTVLITDEKGQVKNQYKYHAFGEEFETQERIINRIRYTGQQYDGVSGQYYLRARFYNPSLGRIMQEDPYRGDGLNLYAYCQNNPVNYYDPNGYSSIMLCPDGKFAPTEDPLALPGPGETSISARRAAAEQKLAAAAAGSGGSGQTDFIGTECGVSIHASQSDLVQSITGAGAQYVGNTRAGDGQIYHMNTPYQAVEIRVMQQKPGQTNPYLDTRTVIVELGSVGQGTGTYTYANGAKIKGNLNKTDRKLIGHTHGQRP